MQNNIVFLVVKKLQKKYFFDKLAQERWSMKTVFYAFPAFLAFVLSESVRYFFLMRIVFGVISTSSSGPMYPNASSNVKCTIGSKRIASSFPELRTFVCCLFTVRFMTRSPHLGCSPTIIHS